ncbi:trimeric intracellular cation channel family protein [Reinekea blandensis]|uniref:Predicted membrane protein n=1 Tax=Reinekea blandensis MED297 TaxID=314283 RepID=A4BHW0_9GAMM|nr:trimeric intracellular cation channel family protein [Reinekea blandensis]EAR08232.1 predicted membrane protein [Reinekea sp. MED297] [Reinekea blandensis MED297]
MSLLYAIELFGVAVFAMAGAIEAARNRFDLFGVLVLAFVSALGGGTLRDLLLDRSPLSWIADTRLAYVALGSGFAMFLLAKFVRIPFRALLYADAVGLAAFTVSGTLIAMNQSMPGLVAVLMGMASGIFGGVIRDIMANEIPLIFRRDVYATASLSGALWIYWSQMFGLNDTASLTSGFILVVLVRFAAIRWQLSLPGFLNTASYRRENHPEDL